MHVTTITDTQIMAESTKSCNSDVVKALHAHLRDEVNSGQDFDRVWSNLLSERSSLTTYSTAMKALASGHWTQHDGEGSRVSWCVQACEDYFKPQGNLHHLLLKDLRRRQHAMPTLVPLELLPPTPDAVEEVMGTWRDRKIVLLDVGSCYNPFLRFKQFDVTAIDIAPAHESVLECDFLSMRIRDEISPVPARFASTCVHTLFTGSFDVVVFSLLLSFFPLPLPRLQCCCRAHQLLKMHGLLLLITPDSSHQNKHAAMIKAWKTCIEAIGFHRWKYEKDVHLHCMAFRKTTPTRQDYSELEDSCHQLYIPQDKQHHKLDSFSIQSPHSHQEQNLLPHLPFFSEQ